MRKDDKASISLIKLIGIALVFILGIGITIGTVTTNATARSIQIIFPNGYELSVLTTKENVDDILKDNSIFLQENEIVTPSLDEKISENNTIHIIKLEDFIKSENSDETKELEIGDIKQLYSTVVEKIIPLEVEIPYETVTNGSNAIGSEDVVTKVVQKGENGLKVVTDKITYMNDIEVARLQLDTKTIKEPVEEIVQVSKAPTSRSGNDRMAQTNPASTSTVSLAQKVSNIEPKVVTLNASAYTASTCGKTNTDGGYGYTASGEKAQAWYTVAAGKTYAFGTVIYIPYFADEPNGGWFVVQDRGGSISNGKIDIYMDTYSECTQFGRRNLECYIYEF